MIDELAAAAGVDPLQFRLEAMGEPRKIETNDGVLDTARLRNLLQFAADKANWKTKLPARQGRDDDTASLAEKPQRKVA